MSSTLLFHLSTIFFLVAGLFFAVTIALWFAFRMPDVIAFYTKWDIRRKKSNVQQMTLKPKTQSVKVQKSVSAPMTDAGSIKKTVKNKETEKKRNGDAGATVPEVQRSDAGATVPEVQRSDAEATLPAIQDDDIEATVPDIQADGTEIGATISIWGNPAEENGITVIEDIMLIHTDEVIE